MIKKVMLIFFIFSVMSNNVNAETYKFVGATFPYIIEKDSSGEIHGIGAELDRKIVRLTQYEYRHNGRLVLW